MIFLKIDLNNHDSIVLLRQWSD